MERGEVLAALPQYEAAKPMLNVRVMPVAGNEANLAKMPHQVMEDLAVVYRLKLNQADDGRIASTPVTNEMLERYGVTAEQLHADAIQQAAERNPAVLRNISEMMVELGDGQLVPEESPLYVATNADRVGGAGVIAYPGFLDEAAQVLGENFYVLPSSIHDVILVPDTEEITASELEQMVQEINAIRLELDDVKELVRLLRICSNNLNQYAKQANAAGSVYRADIQDLQERMDGLWQMTKEILARLASVA